MRNALCKKVAANGVTFAATWWTIRDSNPRPLRCERSALPTELIALNKNYLSCIAKVYDSIYCTFAKNTGYKTKALFRSSGSFCF